MKQKFLFLALVALILILPLEQAKAVDIASLVGTGLLGAFSYLGGWIMQALSSATAGLVAMASALLQGVLNLNLSYTSGGIVAIGWPITRDLANIVFVIILVVIGLGTALRLEGYQAKKTLLNLVFIILLINFTPVIAGLIIDASNIVMNFFLEGLKPGAYWDAHLAAQRAIAPNSIWEGLNPFKNTDQLLSSSVLVSVDLIVFFILLAYAVLFLVRYVAIWVLVILSPVAFASFILPMTKGWWKMWWNQFFQWCIIGVSGGFFLYLGTQFLSMLATALPTATKDAGLIGSVNIMMNIMPLITIALFFIIGFIVSLSTSAMGAKYITTAFKKGGAASGKVLGFATAKGAWEVVKAPGKILGMGKGREAYKIMQKAGWGKRQSFGAGAERAWTEMKTRITHPSELVKATGQEISAARKGTWNAIKGAVRAGGAAMVGIKLKKKPKGSKRCPQCNNYINEAEDVCPKCGNIFNPEEKTEKKEETLKK